MSFALTDLSPANPLKAPRSCVSLFLQSLMGNQDLLNRQRANV